MSGNMTPRGAVGILRRRREYLEDHVVGKRMSGLPSRHEEQEIRALTLAIEALGASLPPTPVDPVTPREYAPGSPRQIQPQGDTHGRTPH